MKKVLKTCAWLLCLGVSNLHAAIHTVKDGQSIQDAVRAAKPGDTIEVYPGTYHETVYIDKNAINLKGIKQDGQWPVLDGEHKLNDGILLSGHGGIIDGFYIRHYKGNGIMTQGGNNFKILNNVIDDTGVYGIFPQYGKNGLVAYNILSGIEDAAIYVGMCENVDVLYNEAFNSVMGIETENSVKLLVESNFMYNNTVGMMISLVPGLPIKVAKETIVRNNMMVNNNLPNFAPAGAIASGLPEGIGLMVYAADEAIVENNIFRGNNSAAIFIADQAFLGGGPADPEADPRPDKTQVLNNLYVDNGRMPAAMLARYLEMGGRKTGPNILATGKGRKNCLADSGAVSQLGTERWSACDAGSTSMGITSYQLENSVESPDLTLEQKGRLTYLAVCTGCHSYSHALIGPPMVVVKALYQGRPKAMAEWIANPVQKRAGVPMPSQAYLSEEVRLQVAKYILEELDR